MDAPREKSDFQTSDQSESCDEVDSEQENDSSNDSEDFIEFNCDEPLQPDDTSEQKKEPVSPEEILLDARFQHSMFCRKEQLYRMKPVESLQDLCVAATVDNMERYSMLESPFNHLPTAILSLIMNALSEEQIKVPYIIHHFITQQTRELRVSLFYKNWPLKPMKFWNAWNIYMLFYLLESLCEHKLQTLDLKAEMPDSEELDLPELRFGTIYQLENIHTVISCQLSFRQLHSMILHQKNLTNISFCNCNITDNTVATIGSTCKNLRFLNVSDNSRITDQSIFYLCGKSNGYGKCKELISLDVSGTAISTLGIFMALANLEDLEELNCDTDKNIRFALMQIVDTYGVAKKLQLNNAVLNHKDSRIVNENIEYICKILPNVHDLRIRFNNLAPFYNFTEINTLKLTTTASSLEISNLLIHYGHHLTTLDLVECSCIIDISLIGFFCPNMEDLRIDSTITSECTYNEIPPTSFCNLQKIVIYQDENIITTLPSQVLIKLLSSSCLEIYQCYQIALPENIMCMLIAEAKDEALVFSNLGMYGCSVSSNTYSIDTWLNFICCAPNLYSIDVEDTLTGEILFKLKRFIIRNRLGVSLTRGLDFV